MSDALKAAFAKSLVAAIQANSQGSVSDATALVRQLSGYGPAQSPLMRRYNSGFMATTGLPNQLPRDPSVFNSGLFTPSLPTPTSPIDPAGPNGRQSPRLYEYQIGHNLPIGPGQTKLVPFKVLRALASRYDVLTLCLNARKAEIAGLDWDIVPREDAEQAKGRSKRVSNPNLTGKAAAARLANTNDSQRKLIKQFFAEPNRIAGHFMSDWLKIAMDEILVIDALSVYEHPTLGGQLAALEILDGSTIKPLIDERGERPLPPNPAFQQFLYGIPRSEFVALLMDAQDDPIVQALQRGQPGPDDEAGFGELTADQLYYRPINPRSWTKYGFSAVEQIIVNCNLALKRQDFHLAYFTDGDIPAMLIAAPETWNLSQIQRYEAQWHSMLAGDNGWKHRVKVIPGVQKAEFLKPPIHDMTFDLWLARITCAGLAIDPAEVGLASEDQNEQKSTAAAARRQRFATTPTVGYFQEYFDSIIRRWFHTDDFVFRFDAAELQDQLMEAQVDQISLKAGALTLNEWRGKRGMERIDDPHADKPNVYLTRDIIPVDQIGELIGAQLDNATMQQPVKPGASPGTSGGRPQNSGGSTPTPRSAGASGSGGSATNAKRSPSSGQSSTSKIVEAQAELARFEKFVSKSRARRFNPEVLPGSLVERVYERMADGESTKAIFADIRRSQSLVADDILGDIVEQLLDAQP
jgi:hypothetical protein